VTSRELRLRVYLGLMLRLRRQEQAVARVHYLKTHPDAATEQDFELLADMSGGHRRWLFARQPHLKDLYQQHCEVPENIIKSLHTFTRQAYRHAGMQNEFADNWHIHALAGQYERVYAGELDKVMVNIPPGMMKPVWVEEPVETDSGPRRLADIQVGDKVLTHRGRYRAVMAVHEQGELPLLRITTSSGRSIRVEPTHPVLTTRGWLQAKDVDLRDSLAIVQKPEDVRDYDEVSKQEARLLGYLVGDGSLQGRTPRFTQQNTEVFDDCRYCASNCGFFPTELFHKSAKLQARVLSIRSRNPDKKGKPDDRYTVATWLKLHGLYLTSSYTKHIPKAVLNSSRDTISQFIGAAWSCDGMIAVRHERNGNQPTFKATYTTVSEVLAGQMRYALWRIGINARVRSKTRDLKTAKQGDRYRSFEVLATSNDEVSKFADVPYLMERKRENAKKARRSGFDDVLTPDRIVEIKPDGTGQCRCLTVEQDSSFTVQELAVHNSALSNVFLPAWIWAQSPEWGIAQFSYSDMNPNRDRERLSKLIRSPWYQRRFGHKFRLTQDSNQMMKNSQGGWRFGGGVAGGGTGMHPHLINIDDPHKADDIASKTEMRNVARWFANTISTRGMILKVRILLIMQRLAINDLCGVILRETTSGNDAFEPDLMEELTESDWYHICFPMEFDPYHPYRSPLDPRTEKGELLWESMLDRKQLRAKMRDMALTGEPNVDAQFRQNPLESGGRIFESVDGAKIRYEDLPRQLTHGRTVRSWDKADSEESKQLDPTAGVLMNEFNKQKTILHVLTAHKTYADRDDMICRVAVADKARWDNYRVVIEKSPGPDGPMAFSAIRKRLADLGIECMAQTPTKSKVRRAAPLAGAIKYGECRILADQDWTEQFIQELKLFPNVDHDDRTDAAAHGYNALGEWAEGKV